MAVETLSNITQDEIEYIRQSAIIKGELDWRTGLYEAEHKGRSEGLAEGRSEEKLDIARNLKGMGLSISQIAKGTGLSPETIDRL